MLPERGREVGMQNAIFKTTCAFSPHGTTREEKAELKKSHTRHGSTSTNKTRALGAPRPRSSACATRAPCAIPSGHSAVPPFRRRSFSEPRGRHFTKKPTIRVGIGPGGDARWRTPTGKREAPCPAARLAAGGADSNPGPPPSPRGVPPRLRLARESQAARRPGALGAGAAEPSPLSWAGP